MKAASNLYDLIHSLSKSEKRYFKLLNAKYVSKNKPNSIKLFEALNSMKKNDEDHLKSIISDESIIKNLAFEKHRLQLIVNQSLLFYALPAKGIKDDARILLKIAEIQRDKGLPKICSKTLDRAISLAEKSENFGCMLDLLAFKKEYIISRRYDSNTSIYKLMEEVKESYKLNLLKLSNYIKLEELELEVMSIYWSNAYVDHDAKRSSLTEQLEPKLFEAKKICDSLRSTFNYHKICFFFYIMVGNKESAYEHVQKLLETSNQLREIQPSNQHAMETSVNVHYNLLTSLSLMKRYEELDENLEKFKKFESKIDSPKFMRLFQLMVITINVHKQFNLKQFDKTLVSNEKFQKLVKPNPGQISPHLELAVLQKLTYTQFAFGNYEQAYQYCQFMTDNYDKNMLQNHQATIKIMTIFLHFEMGNHLLLKSLSEATYRYLKTRQQLNNYDILILNHVKTKLYKIKTKKDLVVFAKDLRAKLLELNFVADNFYNKFYLFDIMSWLISKIEDRPLLEIISEKVNP